MSSLDVQSTTSPAAAAGLSRKRKKEKSSPRRGTEGHRGRRFKSPDKVSTNPLVGDVVLVEEKGTTKCTKDTKEEIRSGRSPYST